MTLRAGWLWLALIGCSSAITAPDASAGDGGLPDGGAASLGPIIVSTPAAGGEREPQVAVTADGRVVVTWLAAFSGGYDEAYRISLDRGQSFGDTAMLVRPADNNIAANASVAAGPDGRLWAAWGTESRTGDTRSNARVWIAPSAPGSTSFGTPVLISDASLEPTTGIDQPRVLAIDNEIVVAWAEYPLATPTTATIVLARSTDGTSWTRVNVTAGTSFANFVRPCASGGRLYLHYLDDMIGLVLRSSDDGGATWPAGNTISLQDLGEVGGITFAPSRGCIARGNEVWVLYGLSSMTSPTGSDALNTLRLAHSIDRGASVDARYSIGDTASGALFLFPDLDLEPGGAIDVGYYAGNTVGMPGSYRHARAEDGHTFAPSTLIQDSLIFTGERSPFATWIGDYVGIAYQGGELFTVYTDNTGSLPHAAFFRAPVP